MPEHETCDLLKVTMDDIKEIKQDIKEIKKDQNELSQKFLTMEVYNKTKAKIYAYLIPAIIGVSSSIIVALLLYFLGLKK
jgi:hypothetical protein